MNKLYIIIFFSAILSMLSSCRTAKKDLTYFQDLKGSESGVLATVPHTNTIEPESSLMITVKSEVPAATAEFNLPNVNPASEGSTQLSVNPQQQLYKVDKDGNIEFPRLGKIHVAGMTTYELKSYLVKELGKYVKDPLVNVTMTGYRIVVMGEVKSPQTVVTTADRFSVLDALAQAGDLTDYALRDNILVLRQTSEDRIEYHRINLHDSKITQSPYFWLKNNDVVLVSPNEIKEENSKYSQNNAYKLSVISTVVGMSSAVISLIIALAVK